MSKDPINFYFLSSGHCGTRFYHHVLRQATNAEVWHQPGHEDIAAIVNQMEGRFRKDPQDFLDMEITSYPRLKRRIDKRLSLPWVYGDTLNWMRAFGHMLYGYIGPERLRLVQLVRHPVATCRSSLADSRPTWQEDMSDIGFAEKVASQWVHQYACIRHQFQAIDDASVCRTVRLEEIDLENLRELYGFLTLDGFNDDAIRSLLQSTDQDVKHYHRTQAKVPASKEELRAVWQVCAPLAAEYGYAEDDQFYSDAPSRPQQQTSAAGATDEMGERPASAQIFDYRGLGLIVKSSSGIDCINIAGGPIAFWPRTQGAFVPLAEGGDGTPGQRLLDYFLLHGDKEFMRGIRASDANFIDSVLAESGLDYIKVNRSRIDEKWDVSQWQAWDGASLMGAPWEAWVPVTIHAVPYSTISGVLSGCDAQGVLVWENSN
ncbi:MAG: hypothetical protein CL389_13080 [Acidiferrobacteraceae bacterium]|jgi:hypothetical protein|nr:hypothetical protein [Acidiferrobacteraceae bacterium]|tara:strand:+ start:2793 stop:4085 length:1293 start_codon:yes stop_codon:yes gene_type:complete